jgi:methyl coenzyme M reductase gamma subunit
MEKLLVLLAIRAFVRNTDDSIKIYNALFSEQKPVVKKEKPSITGITNKPIVEVKKPSKRDELLESLTYLKSKKVKTKQDKDSIGVLEAVLKNMGHQSTFS